MATVASLAMRVPTAENRVNIVGVVALRATPSCEHGVFSLAFVFPEPCPAKGQPGSGSRHYD